MEMYKHATQSQVPASYTGINSPFLGCSLVAVISQWNFDYADNIIRFTETNSLIIDRQSEKK